MLYGHESVNPNFTWMRAVTKEEAQRSLKRWSEWAAKPMEERMPKGEGVGEWLYQEEKPVLVIDSKPQYVGPYNSWAEHKAAIENESKRLYEEQYGLKDSLTLGAKQLQWKTPTEFLLCPQDGQEQTLQAYLSNLTKGKLFTRNQFGDGGYVIEADYNAVEDALYVLTDGSNPVKPYALCRITFQDGCFIHENRGSFFHDDGGQKYFTIAMGREWTGGDVFDDLC